jgi:hypothetical protein
MEDLKLATRFMDLHRVQAQVEGECELRRSRRPGVAK